jgi:hypothetical protein
MTTSATPPSATASPTRYNGRNRLSRVSMGRTTYYSNTYNARGEREEKSLMAMA